MGHSATTYGIQRDSIMNSLQLFPCNWRACTRYNAWCLGRHSTIRGQRAFKVSSIRKKCCLGWHKQHNHELPVCSTWCPQQTIHYFSLYFEFIWPFTETKRYVHTYCLLHWNYALFYIRLTAAQMWCLSRLLPMMIDYKIPVADVRWQNFLLLSKIIDYIFVPVLLLDHVAYLHVVIEEHHRTFTGQCPSGSITMKMHYYNPLSSMDYQVMLHHAPGSTSYLRIAQVLKWPPI